MCMKCQISKLSLDLFGFKTLAVVQAALTFLYFDSETLKKLPKMFMLSDAPLNIPVLLSFTGSPSSQTVPAAAGLWTKLPWQQRGQTEPGAGQSTRTGTSQEKTAFS